MLSSIKLKQAGYNMKLILKIIEKTIAVEIIKRIRCEVLRKRLYSSCVRGFSGVSSGHKIRIEPADKTDRKRITDE